MATISEWPNWHQCIYKFSIFYLLNKNPEARMQHLQTQLIVKHWTQNVTPNFVRKMLIIKTYAYFIDTINLVCRCCNISPTNKRICVIFYLRYIFSNDNLLCNAILVIYILFWMVFCLDCILSVIGSIFNRMDCIFIYFIAAFV